MADWPEWEVSSLSPVLVVERCSADEVRNVANFRIGGEGLLRSTEGAEAVARARLGAAAPALARGLEAACYALRSYQYGNASPELAQSTADAGDRTLADARSGEAQADAPSVAGFLYPAAMTSALAEVLGMPSFRLHSITSALRVGGREIRHRYEDEMAAALHFLIPLALQHGGEWWQHAHDQLQAMMPDDDAEEAASDV